MDYYPDPFRAAISYQFKLGIEYRRISDHINTAEQARKARMTKDNVRDDIKRKYNQGPTPVETTVKQHEMALQERRRAATKGASTIGISKNKFKGGKPLGKNVKTSNHKSNASAKDALGTFI